MEFWKDSGYNYSDLVDLSTDKLLILLNSMNRQDIISWLSWNDPNGIYIDEQSIKELGVYYGDSDHPVSGQIDPGVS